MSAPHPPQQYPRQGPPAAPQQARAKGRNRGCWIAVFSGCGVLFIVMGVLGFVLYEAAKDAPIDDIAWTLGEGVKTWRNARNAPGTDAMREAGCNEAMVVNMSDLSKFAERFDAGSPAFDDPDSHRSMVACTMGWLVSTDGSNTCHKIKRSYLDGGGAPGGSFILIINKSGKNKPVCTELYQRDGTHLESLNQPAP